MNIYAISDLHLNSNNSKPMNIFGPVWQNHTEIIKKNWNDLVKPCDIVLVAGDISWAMKFDEAKVDLDYFNLLKGTKIIIKGNHDYWWPSITKLRDELPKDIIALQNDAIRFDGVVICGTRGWVVAENNKFKSLEDEKIYKREVLRLEMSLINASKLRNDGDKLICMMHYPPLNTRYQKNEFSALFEKYNVDVVVFGHLHNFDTPYKLKFTKNKVKYFLSSCDLLKNELVKII